MNHIHPTLILGTGEIPKGHTRQIGEDREREAIDVIMYWGTLRLLPYFRPKLIYRKNMRQVSQLMPFRLCVQTQCLLIRAEEVTCLCADVYSSSLCSHCPPITDFTGEYRGGSLSSFCLVSCIYISCGSPQSILLSPPPLNH